MKTLFSSLLALGICCAAQVHGAIQPVNIVLQDTNLSYSIPAGKVLQIEHLVWALETAATHQTIAITPADVPFGTGSFELKFTLNAIDSWTPTRPIRIVGGTGAKISILNNGIVDWRDVMIVGLLIDPEDLYAGIPSELSNPRIDGNKLVADVEFASPRPRVAKIEVARDVDNFQPALKGQLAETTSPSFSVASVPAAADRKFMRLHTVARMD